MLAIYSWIVVACIIWLGASKVCRGTTLVTRRHRFTTIPKSPMENGSTEPMSKFLNWVGFGVFGTTSFGGDSIEALLEPKSGKALKDSREHCALLTRRTKPAD